MTYISLDRILINPDNPRKLFDPDSLQELANSIVQHGILEPVVVEETSDNYYILVDGERRLRAAKIAGLVEILSHIVPSSNGSGSHDRLIRAMITNIQRQDLGPVEEAVAYKKLIDLGDSIDDVAGLVSKSGNLVRNRLLLLELDPPIQDLISAGFSSDARVAKALLAIPDPAARVQLANACASRHSSIPIIVRAAEKLAARLSSPPVPKEETPALFFAAGTGRGEPTARPSIAQWDALAQVGQMPPWPVVIEAARGTCKSCSLAENASQAVCKECPAPDLLSRMIAITGKRKPS